GLCAQWVGVYLNEAKRAKSWPIRFMQAVLLNQVTGSASYRIPDSNDPHPAFSTVYTHFGVKTWNFWQDYKTWNHLNTKSIVMDVMHSLLAVGPATISPEKFKMAWYK